MKSSKVNDAALSLSTSHQKKSANIKHMTDRNKQIQDDQDSASLELTDILANRFRANRIYPLVMFVLAVGIIWTAVLTAEQVQQYHNDYMKLQKMKVAHRNLQIENQRLIIEQQTFSATPQIASRAVTQLGMFSPSTKDKLILQPMASTQGDRLNVDDRITILQSDELTQGGQDE